MALSIVVPVVLVLVIVLLTVSAMVVYSVRARRRRSVLVQARVYRQHQAALQAAGHFDDAAPYGQCRHFDTILADDSRHRSTSVSVTNVCYTHTHTHTHARARAFNGLLVS